jgi:exosortase H (IPTLxxWG-CTERM-specific)
MTGTSDTHKPAQDPQSEPCRKSSSGFVRENWPIVQFILITILSLVLFFLLLRVGWVKQSFSEPYTHFVAASSRLFLRMIGVQAAGTGTVITSPDFTVNILYVCNGLEATAIFFATVLGFPARWRNKLIGLALGYPVIFFINILRIAALFLIGYTVPQIFETVHYYYAQAFVILATVGVWLLWVSRYSAYGTKNGNRPAD